MHALCAHRPSIVTPHPISPPTGLWRPRSQGTNHCSHSPKAHCWRPARNLRGKWQNTLHGRPLHVMMHCADTQPAHSHRCLEEGPATGVWGDPIARCLHFHWSEHWWVSDAECVPLITHTTWRSTVHVEWRSHSRPDVDKADVTVAYHRVNVTAAVYWVFVLLTSRNVSWKIRLITRRGRILIKHISLWLSTTCPWFVKWRSGLPGPKLATVPC